MNHANENPERKKINEFGEFRYNYSLGSKTWFGVGGACEILFKPSDTKSLAQFLQTNSQGAKLPITILGNTSNVIIRDGGIPGVTIKLGRQFSQIEPIQYDNESKNIILSVGSATLDTNLAAFAAQNGISGMEFLSTIPGSIGGAIRMNAGCFGGEIKDVLASCTSVDFNGNIHEFINLELPQNLNITERIFPNSARPISFLYRKCILPKDLIFTNAILVGTKSPHHKIEQTMFEMQEKRNASQPIRVKTGGSTFKNLPNKSAWQFVREAGLAGYTIGGAMVSEKHTNFLINTGNATAQDIENLGEHVIKTVFDKTGVTLEWEIERIGAR